MDDTAGTELLHYDNPTLTTFTARVVAHRRWRGAPSLVLDRTAFYPEAGGQGPDHGRIGEARVTDVQIDRSGVVHHVVEGHLPEAGDTVAAEIDWPRRRDLMAQHTGQHLLSQAMLRVAGARTVSSRLGERVCTLDFDLSELTDEQLREAESLVNRTIDEDLEVRAYFPEPSELARLPLRRRPKVEDRIRVVMIGDFEVVPCGGTHCTRTAQIGLLHITGAERYKGMIRVTFVSGQRARDLLVHRSRVLTRLGRGLSSGPLEVPDAVAALRRELDETKESLRAARRALAQTTAEDLLARTPDPVVTALLPEADASLLREVGRRIVAEPERAALLAAPSGGGLQIFAARGQQSDLDCGALVRSILRAANGRGGGRPDHAEGRLPAGVDWPALVREHLG